MKTQHPESLNECALRKATLALGALVLASCAGAHGDEKSASAPSAAYTRPQAQMPAASAGFVNDWLREQSPAFDAWDIGAQFRARYEIKEDGGSFPNFDFRRTGVDNDNSYFLLREKVHVGYTPWPWLSIFAEGRDSSSTGD